MYNFYLIQKYINFHFLNIGNINSHKRCLSNEIIIRNMRYEIKRMLLKFTFFGIYHLRISKEFNIGIF